MTALKEQWCLLVCFSNQKFCLLSECVVFDRWCSCLACYITTYYTFKPVDWNELHVPLVVEKILQCISSTLALTIPLDTVNLEIFIRVLFFAKLRTCSFVKLKPLQNHCRLLVSVNHAQSLIFDVANMSFNAIHENKILTKISEFTVQYNGCCELLYLNIG